MSVTHTFVSSKSDGDDDSLVQPSDWNADHEIDISPADIGAAASDHEHDYEAAGAVTAHAGAADPHTGYRLESADHSHASTGLQGGKLAQSSTHESPDTDAGTSSLHHTIGTGANQAAAGNHTHATGTEYTFSNGVKILTGSGNPEGSVTAPAGSMYLSTDGELYIKTSGSGNTGWSTNLNV